MSATYRCEFERVGRDLEVSVDLDEGKGIIFVGFHNGGNFTVTEVAA